jgi:hypothetical protein
MLEGVGNEAGGRLRLHLDAVVDIRATLRTRYAEVIDIFSGRRGAAVELPERLQPESFRDLFSQLADHLEAIEGPEEALGAMSDPDLRGDWSELAPHPGGRGGPVDPAVARTLERGRAILDEFESRQGPLDDRLADLLDELDVEPSKTYPGRAEVPQKFDVGNFSHYYAEELIPESELPRGLEPEVTIRLPGQGEVRLDRVDWENGVVYEIKPDTPSQVAAGEQQASLYAHYMNEHHPLSGGGSWRSRVVTYDSAAVVNLLQTIGWLE